jgi:hypothetical protein
MYPTGSSILPIPGGSNSAGGGIPEAPIDNKPYERKNAGWTEATSGGALTYTHTQSTAAATWNIQHTLGKKEVSALPLDEQEIEIIGAIDWSTSTVNLLVIKVSEPVAGTAYIKY